MTNLAIRAFSGGKRIFEEVLALTDEQIESDFLKQLAEAHAIALVELYPLHMIEIEFLDEKNPLERFFRFGTDPAGMLMPYLVQGGRPPDAGGKS